MSDRKRYAYRLNVVLPDGPTVTDDAVMDDDGWFHWPARRVYFDQRNANRRADLFRKYGATVTVERSDPIVWTETP